MAGMSEQPYEDLTPEPLEEQGPELDDEVIAYDENAVKPEGK